MHYTIHDDELHLHCPSPRHRSKVSTVKAPVPDGIALVTLKLIAETMIQLMTGLAWATFKEYSRALAGIFSYFVVHGKHWPQSNQWKIEIFNIYCYQLQGFSTTRSTDSSRTTWAKLAIVLRALMKKGVIPNCPLPDANLPSRSRTELGQALAIGESYESVNVPRSTSSETLPKQYLVDLSYMEDSPEFFHNIQSELQKSSDVVFSVTWSYWENIQFGHRVGRELVNSVSRADLMDVINYASNHRSPRFWKGDFADPSSSRGLAYFLAAADYYFFELRSVSAVCLEAFRSIPFFNRLCRSARKRKALFGRLREELKAPYLSGPDLIARALGLLSSKDCAAIGAILIHEQPRFTPDSLRCARAYDKNGKLYVSLADASGESVFFTVAKGRAVSRKGGLLTSQASKVMAGVEEMTRRLRERLEIEQPDVARQLFLVVSKSGMGHAGPIGIELNKNGNSIFSIHRPQLEAANITRHTFTLSKIRTTQGILVWLKTEAIISMAAALGNTPQTILNNYIHDWLYHRMLVSVARRTQQKLIVLATAGEDWQLEVSDFSTVEQLENFIVRTLASDHGSNDLSTLFYKAFSSYADIETQNLYESVGNEFHICVSPESIAALEVYVVYYSTAPFVLKQEGGEHRLNLAKLSRLYQLISAAAHADPSDEAESFVLDLIAGGSQAQLKHAWAKSRSIVEKFKSIIIGRDEE